MFIAELGLPEARLFLTVEECTASWKGKRNPFSLLLATMWDVLNNTMSWPLPLVWAGTKTPSSFISFFQENQFWQPWFSKLNVFLHLACSQKLFSACLYPIQNAKQHHLWKTIFFLMQSNSERYLPFSVRWIYHFYWKLSRAGIGQCLA